MERGLLLRLAGVLDDGLRSIDDVLLELVRQHAFYRLTFEFFRHTLNSVCDNHVLKNKTC